MRDESDKDGIGVAERIRDPATTGNSPSPAIERVGSWMLPGITAVSRRDVGSRAR